MLPAPGFRDRGFGDCCCRLGGTSSHGEPNLQVIREKLPTGTAEPQISGFFSKLLDAQLPGFPAFTIHDLRRTAASGLAALGVQLPVIEKVLNHQSGSFRGVCGVYQRHSYSAEKRAALELWSEHVKRLGTAPDGLPLAA